MLVCLLSSLLLLQAWGQQPATSAELVTYMVALEVELKQNRCAGAGTQHYSITTTPPGLWPEM